MSVFSVKKDGSWVESSQIYKKVNGAWVEKTPDGAIPTLRFLPDGYNQVEYCQSSGEQYIDTGFVPTKNTKVVMQFQLTEPGTSNECIFGVAGQFSFRWYGSGSRFRSNGSNNSNFSTDISATDRHTVEKTATVCTIDDTYSVTNTAGTVSRSFYLCAQNNTNGPSNYAKVNIYSCQIYENDTLVRDFVPCISGNDEVGMYDILNNQFYGNAGSGAFTGGDTVSNVRYQNGGEYVLPTRTVTVTGTGASSYCYLTINGNKVYSARVYHITSGDEIECSINAMSCSVTLNGETVMSKSGTYTYTVASDCSIALSCVGSIVAKIEITTT